MNDLLSLDVKIYCLKGHLRGRGIQNEDLMEELIFIGEKELSGLILNCDAVTAF